MDKDAEAHYTRWCVISVAKEQTSTGSILRRKNPALSNSTMPPAGSARKSGWMQMQVKPENDRSNNLFSDDWREGVFGQIPYLNTAIPFGNVPNRKVK